MLKNLFSLTTVFIAFVSGAVSTLLKMKDGPGKPVYAVIHLVVATFFSMMIGWLLKGLDVNDYVGYFCVALSAIMSDSILTFLRGLKINAEGFKLPTPIGTIRVGNTQDTEKSTDTAGDNESLAEKSEDAEGEYA
ncbi:MAG: hypothetical protein LBR73_02465 [Oscillospiraceae bacterium]|jgi:hypothetical protein|nr:hypothetical protein [Oscillospiraceae bacterium]